MYWNKETPIAAVTEKNRLEFYAEHLKLSVARGDWEDDNNTMRRGKTVALDITAICEGDLDELATFERIFREIHQVIMDSLEARIGEDSDTPPEEEE